MEENVLCWNCSHLISIDTDCYWEHDREEPFDVVKCDNCKELNAVSWCNCPHFSANELTENDKKSFACQTAALKEAGEVFGKEIIK